MAGPKFNGGFGGDRFERIVEGQLSARKSRREQKGINDRKMLLEAYGVEAMNQTLEGSMDSIMEKLQQHGEKLEKGEIGFLESRAFDVLDKPALNARAIQAFRETLKDGGEGISDEELTEKLYKKYQDDSAIVSAGDVRWGRNPLRMYDALKSSDERKKATQRLGQMNEVLAKGGTYGFDKTPAFEELDKRAFEHGYRVFTKKDGYFDMVKAEPMSEFEGLVRAELEAREARERATEAGAVELSPDQQKIVELETAIRERDAKIERTNADKARDIAVHGQINEVVLKLIPVLVQNGGAELVPEVRKLIDELKKVGVASPEAGAEEAA